ncbi:MAG: CheR family methyltransferase [Actinomycetota bacterium]|nr:CheR family methyltransferase [Actinomycetota bacterium]MDZ4180063.1 CheR family methyltransferase [Coriobacteriia bacterium]
MVERGESISKDLTPEEFQRFRDYINQHSGIFLEEQKTDSLRISLITRATRHEHHSLDEYFKRLTTDEDEFNELMNLVTINETSFFRFPQQFDALRTAIIPEILEKKSPSSRHFRVWSAGCSTGEEPYTIAMTLLDSGLEGLGYTPEVLGTDVSTNALLKAKKAVYPARGLLSIPHGVSGRFFEPTPHGHHVTEKVRRLVTLQYHNLIKEPYPVALMGNWDVVFCRNVTIYFRLESTRRVVQNFYDSLNPGGYLFIGHSETLTSISDRFEPVEVGGVFLYRKPRDRSVFGGVDLSQKTRTRRTTLERMADRAATPGPTPLEQRRRRIPLSPPSASAAPKPDVEIAEEVSGLLSKAETASAAGDSPTVFESVRRVLELEPHNAKAYLLAASAHADIGDLDAAYEECQKALAIDPLIAAARYVLGMIHLRRDEKMLALSEFKRTIYTDSGFVLAHLNLGNLYKSLGATQDACREYELTLRTMYENPEGGWTAFMGGFRSDLLAKTVERSLVECRKGVKGP